jgi:XisI protein
MDKALKYHHIISELFEEFINFWDNGDGVQRKSLYDEHSKTYTLVYYGWQDNKRYLHGIAFHLQLLDDEVWIHQNNTQYLIIDELVEKGIEKTDIVIGFIPNMVKKYTDSLISV